MHPPNFTDHLHHRFTTFFYIYCIYLPFSVVLRPSAAVTQIRGRVLSFSPPSPITIRSVSALHFYFEKGSALSSSAPVDPRFCHCAYPAGTTLIGPLDS